MVDNKITGIPQPGDSGPNVAKVQEFLNSKGYNLKVDGEFGPKTRKAMSQFQKSVGLTGTGVPGEKTIAALGLVVEPVKIEPLEPILVGQITRQVIADVIVNLIQRDVDAKLRETHGKNRSPRIDTFNRRAKSYLGAPYCASGGWCAIDDACLVLGLKNPVPPTASSQAFRRTSFVPAKYIRDNGELGKKGDVGVLQNVGNPSHGHYVTVSRDQESHPIFHTVEYNTDAVLFDRDGDGAYALKRSTVDRSRENAGKIFVCFTDVPQWVLDHNEGRV